MRWSGVARAGVGALLLLGCGDVDDFVPLGSSTATHDVRDAQRIVVRNVCGTVRIRPGADDAVTVKTIVRGRESTQGDATVAAALRNLRIDVRRSELGQPGDELVIENGGEEGPRESPCRVDLEIEAPASLPWSVYGYTGDVHVEAGGNDVFAESDVGAVELGGSAGHVKLVSRASMVSVDVECITGGSLEARADDVKLVVRRDGPTEELALLSLEGDVELELPRSASARAVLRSSLGDVTVQGAGALAPREERKGHVADGDLGGGGPTLRATTESGDVRLVVKG